MALKNVKNYGPDTGLDGRIASEALTKYKAVKINASDSAKVDLVDTAGERAYGAVDVDWDSGDTVQVIRTGIVKMVAGAAVSANTYVALDASARVITATSAHDYIFGLCVTAGSAAGDVVSVLIAISPNLPGFIDQTGVKVAQAAVSYADGTTENATSIVLPAKCVVLDCYVDVTTAEATGSTKLIDVGTSGTGSDDPDGFIDGASVAATGIVRGAPTFTAGGSETYFASSTVGDLLAPTQVAGSDSGGDVGTYIERPDSTSGGETVSWTPSAVDWAEFVGTIYVVYVELA